MAPLIPIALQIAGAVAPRIARWIAGDEAGDIAETVVSAAKDIAGVDDPEDALDRIKADPALFAQLQTRLAEIEIAKLEAETDQLRERERTARASIHSTDAFVRRARPTGLYVAATLFFLAGATVLIGTVGGVVAALQGDGDAATALMAGVSSLLGNLMPIALGAAGVGGLYVRQRSQDKAVEAGHPPEPGMFGELGRAMARRVGGRSTGLPPAAEPM